MRYLYYPVQQINVRRTVQTQLQNNERDDIRVKVDSCWRRLDKDADGQVTWMEFKNRVGEFLDSFGTKSKKMRADGQDSQNVRDFLFRDETGRNTDDRSKYTDRLPPRTKQLVQFVEQVCCPGCGSNLLLLPCG